MPKRATELSAIEVKRLTDSGFHPVGGVAGLHLQVKHRDSRSWILRATVGSKRRDIGLGGYPDVSLAAARDSAREAREQIRMNIDPVEARRAGKAVLIAAQAKALTFAQAATLCHTVKAPAFKNKKHRADWISSVRRYANPVIGEMSVADVELAHIVKVLEPIWITKTETASRLRQRIEAILAWATVNKYRDGDNPARWRGNLEHALPNPSKVKTVQHFPSLPWQDVGNFVRDLRKKNGIGARALEFAILTATRSGDVRGATWDEFDLEGKIWTLPSERMKSGKAHRVPLSDPVIKLLEALPRVEGSPYVFTSNRGNQLSDMALNSVIRRMKVDAVPHGMRSSFKDWCRNSTDYPDEVSELALAHVGSDATRAAYARDELLSKRTILMEDWAKFCATVSRKATVTRIRVHN